jgi:hypothetical protein
MEQHDLKNIKNCLNTNIYSYLEISGGQSSNPYLNPYLNLFSIPELIRNLRQLRTVVFLHWCLIHAVPLVKEEFKDQSSLKRFPSKTGLKLVGRKL